MSIASTAEASGLAALPPRAARGPLLIALLAHHATVCAWTTASGHVLGVRHYDNDGYECPLEVLTLYVADAGVRPTAACIVAAAGIVRRADADTDRWSLDVAEARDWLGLAWLSVLDAPENAAPGTRIDDAFDRIARSAGASLQRPDPLPGADR